MQVTSGPTETQRCTQAPEVFKRLSLMRQEPLQARFNRIPFVGFSTKRWRNVRAKKGDRSHLSWSSF